MGQAALFLIALGPGVAEIDIDPGYLAGGEQLRQPGGIGINEEHVLQTLIHGALHGNHHGIRYLFHGDEQGVRLCLGRARCEATLAAAQLHLQIFCLGVQLPPMAPQILRTADPAISAGFHAGMQVLLFSHTHDGVFLPDPAPPMRSDFCNIIPQNMTKCKRIKLFSPGKRTNGEKR